MSGNAGRDRGIGLAAFDSLYAEKEEWLDQCLVLPYDFEWIAGGRSYLVVGPEGSGKTALYRALRRELEAPPDGGTEPDHLTICWRPRSLAPELTGKDAALAQLAHALAGCADALLAYLAHWPDRFVTAPGDAQATLRWFVCRYLEHEADRYVQAHLRGAIPAGAALLRRLVPEARPDEWLDRAEPREVVAEVIKALRFVGPETMYVLVGPDDLGDSTYLSREMTAFLSALTLFESSGFVWKVIIPERLLESVGDAAAIDRRRIELAPLRWEPEELCQIVLARLRLATGEDIQGLNQVCEDPQLADWLARTGGGSPRGWLQSIRPLALRYLRRRQRVATKEWRSARRDPPPALRFNPNDGAVTVGWRKVDDLTDVPLALFEYLYAKKGKRCSREELYYEAYLPAVEPSTNPVEKEYDDKSDHLLESAILRLRQAIEPDPGAPVYVVTHRGFGYSLRDVR